MGSKSNYFMSVYKNGLKAQYEIIKENVNPYPFSWYYGTYKEGDTEYECVTDPHVLIAFPFNFMAINTDIFKNYGKVLEKDTISQLVNGVSNDDYYKGNIIGSRIVKGTKTKKTYDVLQLTTGVEILFNHDYKKYFPNDATFYGYNDKTPIKVYNGIKENGTFLGVIMPIVDNNKTRNI